MSERPARRHLLSRASIVSASPYLALTLLTCGLAWSYWTTLATMAERWETDPQYSHGFLVPLFALVLLGLRRERLRKASWQPCWWGLSLLLPACLLRLAAGSRDVEVLDSFSLLPSLAGVVLLVGGWQVLVYSWPAIAFLGFMLPLPYTVEQSLAIPLRRLATLTSTYVLETVGFPAVAEGNTIWIDDIHLEVVHACSGLGMLMTFFALATALAIITHNRWQDKLVLIVSAIPIAVVANVVRISATGVAYVVFGEENTKDILHDLAGWLMMPFALLLLWLELRFLDRLFIEMGGPAPLQLAGVGRSTQNSRAQDITKNHDNRAVLVGLEKT